MAAVHHATTDTSAATGARTSSAATTIVSRSCLGLVSVVMSLSAPFVVVCVSVMRIIYVDVRRGGGG
jgi:hypothetical protein